jgi:alpha-N-arabinofuranosidase
MKIKNLFTAMLIIALSAPLVSQDGNSPTKAYLKVDTRGGTATISRHIYGHFSEHLGHCIYGGYWVGYDSGIPHTNGIRNDVVEALRQIGIPNLRWPGGCFADEYHWMDGIGDPAGRPRMVNTHWGGVTEDNRFGTHEFLELCEQLGTEPVICGNVGSGTVKEMSQWVEYLNFDGISPMADLRRANGRESAWGVKFWGVGNENWGCGGHMTADFYADQFRRYATFCRNYGDNRLFKIAGGANSEDYGWTETLMQKIPHQMMDGISLHYYTANWSRKGPATGFGEDLYFDVLKRCLHIEKAIDRHMEIMDRYDPQKRVALVFDEWGTWYDVEPGTNPGFLFQQNSMRDALVAALTLNYLNARCERVRMANIAQTINVLQALIFTEGDKMLLTPTYHIYDMYKVHHDATMLPQTLQGPGYVMGTDSLPAISASASLDASGRIHLSLVNIDPSKAIEMEVELAGKDTGNVKGRLLASKMMDGHNSFEHPDEVVPVAFEGAHFRKGKLELILPARSVVVLEVE